MIRIGADVQRKTLVCLANSRKHSGRCVAGIEWNGHERGSWIRPVSERSGHEVSEKERNYKDGSDPQVLDIVSVPLLKATPSGHQSENWLIEAERPWMKKGQVTWDDLPDLESDPTDLWSNEAPDSYSGTNDRVTLEHAGTAADSLRLIRVTNLQIQTLNGYNGRQARAYFTYLGRHYNLTVTDPVIDDHYLAMINGTHSVGDAFLTVSLGEGFTDDYCYKLVAAIITKSRARGTQK